MAAPGRHQLATPIDLDGLDQYRAYSEEPQVGGWRELLEPISGRRYWSHVASRFTTWSLVELLRLNGLEEFLLLGQWGVFVAVPENVEAYEDREWGLPYYQDDRCTGLAVGKMSRGQIFVSLGFPRPGVLEVLLPDEGEVVIRKYCRISAAGFRMVQRLPARVYNDDLAGMAAITVPMFRVRPERPDEPLGRSALVVTEDRDPRSTELGFVRAGTPVGLAMITGTRAQLARVPDGQGNLWGGWISLLLLDGTPTLERVLEDTENMKLAEQLSAELARIEALRAAAIANGEDPDSVAGSPHVRSRAEASLSSPSRSEGPPPASLGPPERSKKPVEYGLEQRTTITGGWRMILDKIWTRPVYVAPIAGRMTWGLTEVLRSGGLDDLLLARSWELCVVDPQAVEAMKDKDWCLRVFSDTSMSGQPVLVLPKGTMVVVLIFHAPTTTAMILLPPSKPGEECGIGYVFYVERDGRTILRALLPQAQVDEYNEDPETLPSSSLGYAENPEGESLEGPYFAEPPAGEEELYVSIGQDIGSDRWARLPRGYSVSGFAEILGSRGRLPDLEGGGWVSLVGSNGLPQFRKQPSIPAKIELPGQAEAYDEEEAKLPIVWPGLGVVWPHVEAPIVPIEKAQLPQLLFRLGGGRAVCDWVRVPMPPSERHIYRNTLTNSQCSLDDLIRHQIWKIAFVEAEELVVRERMDPRSAEVARLPRGALVIAEWVAPGAAVRLLVPARPQDPKPRHAWAQLGDERGAFLSPLAPGGDFWIEPKGGHLTSEEQDEGGDFGERLFVRTVEDPDTVCTLSNIVDKESTGEWKTLTRVGPLENPNMHLLVSICWRGQGSVRALLVRDREQIGQADVFRTVLKEQSNSDATIHDVGGEKPSRGDLVVFEYRVGVDEGHELYVSSFKVNDVSDCTVKASSGFLQRGDGVQLAELSGRRARLAHTKCIVKVDTAPQGGWMDIFDESGWSILRARWQGEVHPRELELRRAEEIEELRAPHEIKPGLLEARKKKKDQAEKQNGDGEEDEAAVAAGDDDLAEADTEASSEAAAELPAILWQIGELEGKSVWTRDWRECIDPIWGQRYFVNKWSGQIIHRLSSMGVACPAVRFTAWFSNLSFAALRADPEIDVEERILAMQRCLLQTIAALADVDEERVEVHVIEGDDAPAADGGADSTRGGGGDDASDLGSAMEDSSLREGTGGVAEAERRAFRVIAVIRAPGARSSWASAALKVAMANGERFTNHMLMMLTGSPDFYSMRIDPYVDVKMLKADLEELDIPRVAKAFEPPPPPPPTPPLPVAKEFEEIQRSYMFTKQKMLHFHCKRLGLGDSQALAGGLEAALPSKPLEELGMWGCMIGDGGAFAMAKVLNAGCGANLQTLLLDENGISAAGATALGAALSACKKLRELGVSKNPIGSGFAKLLSGIGEELVILDASKAELDDSGASAAGAALRRWPALRSLRLGGNTAIGPLGVEAVARALVGAPSVKLADLTGANDGGEWPRLSRVLKDGGVDPSRLRLR